MSELTRDRESDVVERVAKAMWNAWNEHDAASGVLNTVMARAAIQEVLQVMIEEAEWPGLRNAICIEDFAEDHNITLKKED